MRYSKLFGKTIKEAPKDTILTSHKLLYQAGYIRESTAGRYYFLPLGMRVQQKIQRIIKEEMDRAGAQEVIAPTLHPKSLWEETNRTNSVGFELMSVRDRNEMEFVLGGTAEEMLVDLVRKFQVSYKDLPFNLYQFSTKFRDELRARGGLLRLREFVMKDAYSFHATEEDFKGEYENMRNVYTRIFERLGLKTLVVQSDNGYIGGEYCDEFIVESEVGESKFLTGGNYSAHEDIADFVREPKNVDDKKLPMQEIEAVRGKTMQDGVKLHNLPLWQQIKSVVFVNEVGEIILACIRGDLDINEVKLMHVTNSYLLRHATEAEIRERLDSEPGFISPVKLAKDIRVIGDKSLSTVINAYTGANRKNRDLINVNFGRDFQVSGELVDIGLAKEGYMSPDLSGEKFVAKRGVEVGNIFQLGFHYSSKMKGAMFTDIDGKQQQYYMGCYGIGLARTLATVVEKYADVRGIVWPMAVAPYQVHLIGIINRELGIKEKVELVYKRLQEAGVEVLYDDREDVSVGAKLADADLIGIPVRLVVSGRTGEKIEWKERRREEAEIISLEQVLQRLSRMDLVQAAE